MASIEQFMESYGEELIDNILKPWLRMQSVSSDDSKHGETIKACDFLVQQLEYAALSARKIELEKGNPLVFAEKIIDKELPTVLVYGHYDVQPIKQPELWEVDDKKLDPFEPTQIGDRLYARGATDDKGQVACHVFAMNYFNKTFFPCNIKFIVEGNEEGGGSSLEQFVHEQKDLLSCDVILISDSGTLVEGFPAIVVGLKGIAVAKLETDKPLALAYLIHNTHDPVKNKTLLQGFYDGVVEQQIDPKIEEKFGDPTPDMGSVIKPEEGYTQLHHRWFRPTNSPLFLCYANPKPLEKKSVVRVTVKGPEKALHSGSYGGPVSEPGLTMCHLIAGLDSTGNKFDIDYMCYGSRVLSTSIQPSGNIQLATDDKDALLSAIKSVVDKYDFDRSLFVIDDVPDRDAYMTDKRLGDEAHTATAYLSFRLVAKQDPQKVLEALDDLRQGVDPYIKMETIHAANAFQTDKDDPYCKAVEAGLQKGYGSDDVHIMAEGGSIPITDTLYGALGVPIIFAGFSSPHDNLHAPNESILVNKGIIAGTHSLVYALQNIGKLQK